MDGWESRRKRVPGHDWCIVRLGLPGVVRGVDIDTSHFLGNHPPFASIDALESERRVIVTDDLAALTWREILPKSALKPGSHNYFEVASDLRCTHLRLNIFPDGGVARLRVHGRVRPAASSLARGEAIDLAAVENGGTVEACNDMFFGPKDNLIMPGRGHNMGDGWETKRKRQLPGHDWVVVRLGAPGTLSRIVVDTNNFKGNYPDRCSIEGCMAPATPEGEVPAAAQWTTILPETPLQGHMQQHFAAELAAKGPFSHVRLNIVPDGGVARLRLFGTPL
jgi:allantoicase